MIEAGEVREYIAAKGWEIQKHEKGKSGPQIVLKVCPLCGKVAKGRADRNFYIGEDNGLWNTYCCDKKGNMLTLKREMGDLDMFTPAAAMFGTSDSARFAAKLRDARGSTWRDYDLPPEGSAPRYHGRLMSGDGGADNEPALGYLMMDRKFTTKTLDDFQIGLARRGFCASCQKLTSLGDSDTCPYCAKTVEKARDMIAIPYVDGGRVVNFKFRSVSGEKRFEKWDGAPTTLFGIDSLAGEYKQVALCEAEFDAMTLHQSGYSCAVATGGSTKKLEDEWIEKLVLFDDVLLAQDNDAAGSDAAETCAMTLGRYRCRRVEFPLKDANDCLRAGLTHDDIRSCVDAAVGYKISTVRPFSDFADELREMRQRGPAMYGKQTRWYDLNRLLGGFRDEELTIVTGDTGEGKTTWTTNVAWDMARGDAAGGRSPVGALVASFEMATREEARKLVQMEADEFFADMDADQLEAAIKSLSGLSLFFVDHYGRIPLADLRDAVEYGVRRYGLWLVVLDHLHFFMDPGSDERKAIDETLVALKSWTRRYGIHIILVVHPTKLRKIEGRLQKVEIDDLRGSASLKQIPDNIIRVWRERDPEKRAKSDMPPYGKIATLKCRSDLGMEAEIIQAFDRRSLRYSDFDAVAHEEEAIARKETSKGKKKTEDSQTTLFGGEPDAARAGSVYVGDQRVR